MKFPEEFRLKLPASSGFQTKPGDPYGAFAIPSRKLDEKRTSRNLRVIACSGTVENLGWDHVSVSITENSNVTPSWAEMCMVKDLFWEETEGVIQFHPPKADHISIHHGCLHLWKCLDKEFPMPPSNTV